MAPQVHAESGSAHRGFGTGSGPKSGSGLIRWHRSGERIRVWPLDPTRTALPPTGTGTQHTLGPVRVGCLATLKEGKSGQTRTEKEIGQNRKKTHLNQRKKSGLLLLFAFAFAFAFAFCFCFCFCVCFCFLLYTFLS